jgi:hypothetical protein
MAKAQPKQHHTFARTWSVVTEGGAMRKIELITFRGWQCTVDFRNQLGELIEGQKLDVEAAMKLVPSPDHAREMGLFGSPTILIDGQEYQQERHGPAGFYWRVYLTAEGFRPYPLAEITAMLQGKPVPPAKRVAGAIGSLPTLVTAGFWPFTLTAVELWNEVARAVGVTLRVVDAESEAGAQVMAAANVAGVPCCVAAPDRKLYGVYLLPEEAKAFLQAS